MMLTDLNPGETGIINGIKGESHLQNRLVELGLLSGIVVRMVKQAPFSGPIEIKFRDSYLSIRWEDARQITLKK